MQWCLKSPETIVCSTFGSGADQRKHQSSASLDFVWGIHRWPVNSSHKGSVAPKMFPFDDVIMHHAAAKVKGEPGDPGNCSRWMAEVIKVTSNVRHGVSNYRPIVCLFIRLLRLTIKEHQMSALQAHCKGNPPVTGRFISQKASYTKNVSNWWRHKCIPSLKWCDHLHSKLNKSETLYKWCSGKSDTAPNLR